jgi:hypothetical protein
MARLLEIGEQLPDDLRPLELARARGFIGVHASFDANSNQRLGQLVRVRADANAPERVNQRDALDPRRHVNQALATLR